LPALVPSFLLLPLVENSINYAIVPKISDGLLRISSTRENDDLTIMIEDNGPGLDGFIGRNKSKKGVGIKITKERLEHLYKDQYALQFENRSSGGLRVLIKIPYRLNLNDNFLTEIPETKRLIK
jgi:sensor histidine kinase YesM